MWKKIVFYVFWFTLTITLIIVGFKIVQNRHAPTNPPAVEQSTKKLTLERAQTLLDDWGRKKEWKASPKVYKIEKEEKGWIVSCYVYERIVRGRTTVLERKQFYMIVRVRDGELTVVQVGYSPGT